MVVIRFRIPDHFPTSSPLRNSRFTSISHAVTGEMTDADTVMNPQHFGSNPAVIRIRINPEMGI